MRLGKSKRGRVREGGRLFMIHDAFHAIARPLSLAISRASSRLKVRKGFSSRSRVLFELGGVNSIPRSIPTDFLLC